MAGTHVYRSEMSFWTGQDANVHPVLTAGTGVQGKYTCSPSTPTLASGSPLSTPLLTNHCLPLLSSLRQKGQIQLSFTGNHKWLNVNSPMRSVIRNPQTCVMNFDAPLIILPNLHSDLWYVF